MKSSCIVFDVSEIWILDECKGCPNGVGESVGLMVMVMCLNEVIGRATF